MPVLHSQTLPRLELDGPKHDKAHTRTILDLPEEIKYIICSHICSSHDEKRAARTDLLALRTTCKIFLKMASPLAWACLDFYFYLEQTDLLRCPERASHCTLLQSLSFLSARPHLAAHVQVLTVELFYDSRPDRNAFDFGPIQSIFELLVPSLTSLRALRIEDIPCLNSAAARSLLALPQLRLLHVDEWCSNSCPSLGDIVGDNALQLQLEALFVTGEPDSWPILFNSPNIKSLVVFDYDPPISRLASDLIATIPLPWKTLKELAVLDCSRDYRRRVMNQFRVSQITCQCQRPTPSVD
jgi:hypothetical protein